MNLTRTEVLAARVHAQQLDRPPADRPTTDAAILDLGVQDTGRDGASWALANRGVPVAHPGDLAAGADLALAWTLRGAPHFYRRDELLDVMVATSPFSDSDAGKRIYDADRPLQEAGISTRDGLSEVASQLRRIVTRPIVKGEVSTRLTAVLDAPYLRHCVPCDATHGWEMPFRLGALYAGLELEPGTSPPVLRRVPGWPRRKAGPAPDPFAAPEHLQPLRAYLRLLGPVAQRDVAGYLDAPLAEVKAHWPDDAVQVSVDGQRRWALDLEPADPDPGLLRLLGPFDVFLQGRDRDVIVPDKAHHRALWPSLGRPGAILSGAELIGTWRPKAAGKKFSVAVDLWGTTPKTVQDRIEEQAVRLADHRGLTFTGIPAA